MDDLLITESNHNDIENLKFNMNTKFDMTNLRGLSYFLGLEFSASMKGLVIHYMIYIKYIFNSLNILNYNLARTLVEYILKLSKDEDTKSLDIIVYKKMVGCLKHAYNFLLDKIYAW